MVDIKGIRDPISWGAVSFAGERFFGDCFIGLFASLARFLIHRT